MNKNFLSEEWWQNATVADVKQELAKGADVDAEDDVSRKPIMYAVVYNGKPDVIEALLAADADVNDTCTEDGMSVLMYAAMFDMPEMIEFLIQNGANINARDYEGATALNYAQAEGHEEAVQKLIELGALKSLVFFDEDWWPKATVGDVTMAINDGADVNATDDVTRYPLMYAAVFSGNPDVLRALAKAGADVNAACMSDGMTALMYAAWQNPNPQMFLTLIDLGADLNAQDDEGNTVLNYAQDSDNQAVLKLLTRV